MAWQQQQQRHPFPPQGQGMGFGPQLGIQRPSVEGNGPPNPFYDAGNNFIRSGLGAYGEKIFGTGREYVQSNVSRYLSGQDTQYYFQVNDKYVKNKIKVVLFPFLHRVLKHQYRCFIASVLLIYDQSSFISNQEGHWTRISEQVAGSLKYRPPLYDINAPDLYIPFMAFGTYVVLSGLALGLLGKFVPESLGLQLTKGLFGWAIQTGLIRFSLFTLGSSDASLMDITAYGGYAFVGISLSILARIIWSYLFYIVMLWTSFSMGTFLVKTMKRVLFAEARSYDRDSTKHHYLLLLIAVAQFPLSFWLGYIRTS